MPKKVIAIIGHGRSVEGKGWGSKIDACDIVVRMWDWHWQDAKDYGTKYDYGFFEIAPTLIRSLYEHNQHEPACGWVGSELFKSKFCDMTVPDNTEIISQQEWNNIGKGLGGLGATGNLKFTRGTIAACWAITKADAGDTVLLVGFDNVYRRVALPVEEGFSQVYRDQPSTFTFKGYLPGQRKYGNHDFGIEQPVMAELARRQKVQLVFSQDLWDDNGTNSR